MYSYTSIYLLIILNDYDYSILESKILFKFLKNVSYDQRGL